MPNKEQPTDEKIIKNGTVEVFEFDTVGQAESEYFKRKDEGCWQMQSAMKIKWSWKKMRNVATFSMKKVEKAYHIDDYMRDIHNCIIKGCEVAGNLATTMNAINKRKREEILKKLLDGK